MRNENLGLLQETVERLFAEHVDKELIVAAESGAWSHELWELVEANGLDRPHLLSEDGCAWSEAYLIARAAGRHAVPLPLVETVLATWLLAQAGIDAPPGPLTVIPALPADGAIVERVPWARHVVHAVFARAVDEETEIGLVQVQGRSMDAGNNIALEPRDRVDLRGAAPLALSKVTLPSDIITTYGALLRAGQMAGALEALLEMSVRYASERIQFGKPLAKFQAIQQELARLAGPVAAAGVAAEAAFSAAQRAATWSEGFDPTFEIAVAKVVAGEAAELAPRIAHQVHGAIGFTYEHGLHFASRRLWSWRAEYGGAAQWSERLGTQAYAIGADGIWPWVTGRSLS